MDVEPTYYVTFTAYDPETNTEVSMTVEPSPGGVLRFQPELRDIWASIDQKLLRERQKSATSKPQKARASKRPTKRPVVKRYA